MCDVPVDPESACDSQGSHPRAEELIAEIYRQVLLARSESRSITAVIMHASHYRVLQAYRNRLGELADASLEYLERYRIFGLEIQIYDEETPRVL